MVQRFTLDMGSSWTKFVDDNGEYVTYADYEKLQKENKVLRNMLYNATGLEYKPPKEQGGD